MLIWKVLQVVAITKRKKIIIMQIKLKKLDMSAKKQNLKFILIIQKQIHQGKNKNQTMYLPKKKKRCEKNAQIQIILTLNFTSGTQHLYLQTVLFPFGHLNVITQVNTIPSLAISDLFGAFIRVVSFAQPSVTSLTSDG